MLILITSRKSVLFINFFIHTMAKAEMEFYDVKSKAKFKSMDWRIVEKNGRYFAVTKSHAGPHECWKVVSKVFGMENMGK